MTRARALSATAWGLTLVAGVAMIVPAGAEPAPRKARQSFDVTIKASTTEVVLGKKVEFKGKVSPKAAGKKVILQQRAVDKDTWKDQGTDTLNKKGKYSFVDKPTTITARKYRVVKPASKKLDKGVSPKVKVTVLRWTSLYDLDDRARSWFSYENPSTINAVDYPKSLVGSRFGHTGFIDWNLERACTTLKVRLGMDDSADATASALLDVSTDGASIFSKSYGFTQSDAKTFAIRDVFRLKFAFTTTNPLTPEPEPDVGAAAAFASPEVLCSF